MERIQKLTELTDDIAQLDKQKRDVAILHLSVLNQERAMVETKEKLEAAKTILNSTLDRIDSAFLVLYQTTATPPHEGEGKKTRSKKVPEASAPDTSVEKHPCHLCEDVFYSKEKLLKHLEKDHKVSPEDGAGSDVAPGCVEILSGEGLTEALKRKAELVEQATVLKVDLPAFQADASSQRSNVPCWNRSCAWSDLAQADHCDADEQFRAGRPVGECKCFVGGTSPAPGQDAAVCFNTGCNYNDPTTANCCETYENAYLCPEVVTAGWGAVVEEEGAEAEPVNQRASIIQAAIAAGDDINEHGVFRNLEIITIPLPKKGGYRAEISIATSVDGQFCYGYDFRRKDGGSSGAPSVTGRFYKTRTDAIKEAIGQLMRTWPDAWTETKLKPIREAVADFFKSINSPIPAPTKEEAKQEAIIPPCQNSACDFLDAASADNCGVPVSERHGKAINRCGDYREELPAIEVKGHEAAAAQAEEEGIEAETAEVEAAPGAGAVEPVTQYQPLDEALGDCELCMGYGVAEGEMPGEATLVPCTCPAGLKVKGGAVTSHCDNCNVEDPDCASCHLPDMDAPLEVEEAAAELPKCTNRSCTANDPSNGLTCLRITYGEDCKSFVPATEGGKTVTFTGQVDAESLPWDQRIHSHPATIGTNGKWLPLPGVSPAIVARIKAGWRGALANSTIAQAAKPMAESTALQKKCPHPKPFRENVDGVETCKVCKMVLSGGGNPDSFKLEPEVWDGPRH